MGELETIVLRWRLEVSLRGDLEVQTFSRRVVNRKANLVLEQ